MHLFTHHTEAFFQIEINGRAFPDGMTEHFLALGITAFVLGLMAYGAFAAAHPSVAFRLDSLAGVVGRSVSAFMVDARRGHARIRGRRRRFWRWPREWRKPW